MALTLYRRHRTECEGDQEEDARSGEFEEGRRGWKKCACLIHVSGTLGGKFSRKQTGKSDWDEARRVVAVWEMPKAWTPVPQVEVTRPLVPVAGEVRTTVGRAIKAFTAEFTKYAAANTQRKYKMLLKKLQTFSDSKGYVMLDQWTPIDIRNFPRVLVCWPTNRPRKNMSTFKACFNSAWQTNGYRRIRRAW